MFSAQAEQKIIMEGLQEIEGRTCLSFVLRTTQVDFIEIIDGSGCFSSLGRLGGRQEISLNRTGCVTHGTVMHEFIHALGLVRIEVEICC